MRGLRFWLVVARGRGKVPVEGRWETTVGRWAGSCTGSCSPSPCGSRVQALGQADDDDDVVVVAEVVVVPGVGACIVLEEKRLIKN